MSSQSKLSTSITKTLTASIPSIPPHVVSELLSLWSSDPRVPSASSRRRWSELRHADPLKISAWFSRRKAAAKKAGNPISEDTYELSLDPPPPPTSACFAVFVLNDLEVKKKLTSSTHPPPARRRGRPRKKIKLEELGSDDSTSTPFSDDTLVASGSDDPKFVPSTSPGLSEFSKRRLKRAYSHFSDPQDNFRAKEPLLSPGFSGVDTNALTNDINHDRELLSSQAPVPSAHLDTQSAIDPNDLSHVHETETEPELKLQFIRDPTQKLCNQGLLSDLKSISKTESESNCDFTCALCIPSFEDFPDAVPFTNAFSSELPLSTLLSSDVLFELLPFSDRRLSLPTPEPEPITNFSSVPFMYRLPNFLDPHQPQPRTHMSTQEYLQHLETQPALSDPKCDLSSFERWEGDDVFEMRMTDEMLDEIEGRRAGYEEDAEGEERDGDGSESDYDAGSISLSMRLHVGRWEGDGYFRGL